MQTPVLDDFNRANEGPPPSASWAGLVSSSHDGGLKVVSNQLVPETAGACSSRRSTVYDANQEVYATIVVKPETSGYVGIYTNIANAGPSPDCYLLTIFAEDIDDEWLLYRVDAGVWTLLTSIDREVAVGDGLGLRMDQATVEAWHRVSGVWSRLFFYPEAGYFADGQIGAFFLTQSGQLDDFGGGNYVAPSDYERSPVSRSGRSIA